MASFDSPLTHCLICKSDCISKYHRDMDNIVIFRCGSCGIEFMNPQYSDRYLAEYYSRYTRDEPEWDEPLHYGHNFYLEILERYLPAKGSLLDIGAGKGHLLAAAIERGWNASGYEIDCSIATLLAARMGINVVCGDFIKLGWSAGQFDAVVMHHVLEHCKDPGSYLTAIHRMVRHDGFLFLVLPNIRSLSSQVKFVLEKLHLRTKNVGAYYDTSHHLWYFTPGTLKRTLDTYGFDVLYMRSGHRVRPHQTRVRRFIMRNITERNLLHSTFLCIARKRSMLQPHDE